MIFTSGWFISVAILQQESYFGNLRQQGDGSGHTFSKHDILQFLGSDMQEVGKRVTMACAGFRAVGHSGI